MSYFRELTKVTLVASAQFSPFVTISVRLTGCVYKTSRVMILYCRVKRHVRTGVSRAASPYEPYLRMCACNARFQRPLRRGANFCANPSQFGGMFVTLVVLIVLRSSVVQMPQEIRWPRRHRAGFPSAPRAAAWKYPIGALPLGACVRSRSGG
jgi:hypothetical protein